MGDIVDVSIHQDDAWDKCHIVQNGIKCKDHDIMFFYTYVTLKTLYACDSVMISVHDITENIL